jgi:thiamine biosynthesis lipoprotein
MNRLTLEPAKAGFPVFGTTAEVLVTDPGALPDAVAALRRDLAAIDAVCSRFRSDSELSRAQASGAVVEVSPLLAEALDAAWHAARLSGGLVDPTVGTAVIALGYDRTFTALWPQRTGPLPAATPAPGIAAVQWVSERRLLRVPPGVVVDLGATTKAWAADRCATALAAGTGGGVLVNLGGDLAACGPAPDGGWRIAVADDHRYPDPASGPVVAITSGGLATSSITVRAWPRRGRTVHHIVDPRTGANPRPFWRTVSVTAASCLEANTAATAALVLGPPAPSVLRRAGLPSRLAAADGTVTFVGGWPPDRPLLPARRPRPRRVSPASTA